MLETLFIWCLVLLPLAVAIVLIAYRARFFVLGITLIALVMMLIWAGLKLGILYSEEPDPASRTTETAISPDRVVATMGSPVLLSTKA